MNQESNLDSIFSSWELVSFPKNFSIALDKAKHRHQVRTQLSRLKLSSTARFLKSATSSERLNYVVSSMQNENNIDLMNNAAAARITSGSRRKYSSLLGQLGYEQLPLKPLEKLDVIDKKAFSQNTGIKSDKSNEKKETQDVNGLMRKIVNDMELINWLDKNEKEHLVNTFISDISQRYHRIQELMVPHFTPAQNRMLAIKIFERIDEIKNEALEFCRRKKQKMDAVNMFSNDTNIHRTKALFRTELKRRIDTDKILKTLVQDIECGNLHSTPQPPSHQDIFRLELQNMKETLENTSHPRPKLDPPIIPPQTQSKLHRRTLLLSQKLPLQTSTKNHIPDWHITWLNSPALRTSIGAAYLKLDETNNSYNTNPSLDSAINEVDVGKAAFETHQQTVADDLKGLISTKLCLEKLILSEISERVSEVQPPMVFYDGRKSWGDSNGEEISNDAEDILFGGRGDRRLSITGSLIEEALNEDDGDENGETGVLQQQKKFDVRSLASRKKDAILHAHTQQRGFIRRNKKYVTPEVNRKRYLKTSERRKHTLEFDYSAFEQDLVQTPPTVENKINDIDLSVLERTLPENHLVRTMNSRVSTRVPKGLITLAAEPAAAITEFGSEVDAKLLNGLDEKLIRFKEVEELYDEIMKTVTGNHFETKSDDSNSISCPAAPYDPRLPISNIFLGLSPKITISTIEQYHYQISGFKVPPTSIFATAVAKATSILNPNTKHTQFTPFTSTAKKPKGIKQNEKYTTRQKILQKYKTHPYSPRIKKFPTRQYVPADDFKTNRFKTMQKIVSSRFNTFKYNYGGYIPYDIDTIRVQKLEGFSVKDYLDFVRGRVTDFVSQLLIDERLDAEVARLKLERDEMEKVEEEGREREEKWRRSCEERRRKMLEFRDGFWNAGVIDYIEEINNDKNDMVESDGDGKVVGIESDAAGKFEGNVESSVPESPDAKPDLTTQPTNKLHPITPKTDLDIKKLQSELESIWIQLKMPTDQKLEMAIKYGSPRFSSKLEKAIELWKTITKNIIEREELLLKIENFESTASDPIRFFRPGTEGSSETRLKEAHQREEFMRKLQYYEARITESVSLIKYELNETVTFDGAPYLEKMKRDYTDIIFKLQKSRPHSK